MRGRNQEATLVSTLDLQARNAALMPCSSLLQPVLNRHHDQDLTYQASFASYNIPAFTLLTFDYGESYVAGQLEGECLCGSEACYSKRAAAETGQTSL
jgi:hypothetical protein